MCCRRSILLGHVSAPFESAGRPNDSFDPIHVFRHFGVHSGRLFHAAERRAERRDAELRVRAGVSRVFHLKRTAGVALRNSIFAYFAVRSLTRDRNPRRAADGRRK